MQRPSTITGITSSDLKSGSFSHGTRSSRSAGEPIRIGRPCSTTWPVMPAPSGRRRPIGSVSPGMWPATSICSPAVRSTSTAAIEWKAVERTSASTAAVSAPSGLVAEATLRVTSSDSSSRWARRSDSSRRLMLRQAAARWSATCCISAAS